MASLQYRAKTEETSTVRCPVLRYIVSENVVILLEYTRGKNKKQNKKIATTTITRRKKEEK